MERIFRPKTTFDWLISSALLPISWIYAFGWSVYYATYALGIKKRRMFQIPIVGVGNLEVGGTGKTPITIEISKWLIKTGRRVAVSANGYGSNAQNKTQLAPEGALDVSMFGDEACLIRNAVPDAGLIVGRRRAIAAEIAESNGFEVLVLDDGYQHLPLGRKVDLLITDSTAVNRRCLPSGPMREPKWGARRATATISYSGDADFIAIKKYSHFRNISTDEFRPLDWICGQEVSASCGIGQPEQFFDALNQMGAKLSNKVILSDHSSEVKIPDEGTWIITEKDAIKVNSKNKQIYALVMEANFEKEEEFQQWLEKNLLH